MYSCPFCNFVNPDVIYTNESLDSLRIHVTKRHRRSSRELYIALFLDDKEPTCACGCGTNSKFWGIRKGFATFCRGHVARIRNNWGHNARALAKSCASRRTNIAAGKWLVWNKGRTKETDPRLAEAGRKSSATITKNSDEVARRSERMRKNRLDGTVKTLYGSEHPQWNGGTSSISWRCHGSYQLYQNWKYPKLVKAGFKCQRCGSNKNLCVHHDKEKMADVIRKISDQLNPNKINDWDLATRIVGAVIDYHIENDVSGEVICEACHRIEHPNLNFKKSTL